MLHHRFLNIILKSGRDDVMVRLLAVKDDVMALSLYLAHCLHCLVNYIMLLASTAGFMFINPFVLTLSEPSHARVLRGRSQLSAGTV